MSSKSNYLEAQLLDLVLGGDPYTPPGTVHLALFTGAGVGEAGVGTATEVAGGGYTRLGVANTLANFPAASGSPTRKTNANLLLWPTATADWGTVVQWAIMDAANGGNVLYYGTFTEAQQREIKTGDTATIGAGVLSITED